MALLTMRRGITKIVTKLFLSLLVVSFLFWGVNFSLLQSADEQPIAKVGDVDIEQSDYLRLLFNTTQIIAQRQGIDNIGINDIKKFAIDQSVIENLVNQALMQNFSKDIGLQISDEYIRQQISTEPSLQTKGKFNAALFNQLLSANDLTEEKYLKILQKEYLAKQYLQSISTGFQSPKVFNQILKRFLYDSVNLKYITFGEKDIEKQLKIITKQQIHDYYNQNKYRFLKPELRKIRYVKIDENKLIQDSEVTDKEIKDFYQSNRNRYHFPQQREIEQIVFPDAQSAEKAYEKLQSGTDFYQIAKEAGFDKETINIGRKTKEQIYDDNIAKIAFELNEKQFSKPIKTIFGFSILRIVSITKKQNYTLEEEKNNIKNEITNYRKKQLLNDAIDEFEKERNQNSDIATIARNLGYQYTDAQFVDSSAKTATGEKTTDKNLNSDLLKEAFKSDIGVENDYIELGQKAAIWFEILQIKKPQHADIQQEEKNITQILQNMQVQAKLEEKIYQIKNNNDKKQKLTEIAKNYNKDIVNKNNLTKQQKNHEIPYEMFNNVFNLKKNQIESYLDKEKNINYLYQITDRKKFQKDEIKQDNINRLKQYSQASKQDIIAVLLNHLKKIYEVEINQKAIDNANSKVQ